jgi:hypothetical protein
VMILKIVMKVRLFFVKLKTAYCAYNNGGGGTGGKSANSGLECGDPSHITEGSSGDSGFCRSQLAHNSEKLAQNLNIYLSLTKRGTMHLANEVIKSASRRNVGAIQSQTMDQNTKDSYSG